MKSYEEHYTEVMDSLFNNKSHKGISISNNKNNKNQRGSSIWEFIFFILLIVNGIFFYQVGIAVNSSHGGELLGIIGVFIVGSPLVIIDFIAVLFYVIKQKPQGIAKFISYTALTIASLMLFYFGIAIMDIYF